MTLHRIIIVGAGAAGLATAEGLRDRGWTGEIVMVGVEPHVPYDRPPLSKGLLAGTGDLGSVRLASAEDLTERNIQWRSNTRAVSLDSRANSVLFKDGSSLSYSSLIIATGVEPRQLPAAQGINGVVNLRTYEDALELREHIAAGQKLLVVGAGFIGLEVAATAVAQGCQVNVVEPADSVLLGRFPAELAQRIYESHVKNGVTFHFGNVVEDWTVRGEALESVVLSDGKTISADAAVVGIGTIPAVNWLEDSGLEISNGIVCNEYGQAAEDIYAVGDVANWYTPHLGTNYRVEHRMSASEQAHVVAAKLTGTEVPQLDMPFFWTDQYHEKWQSYGYVHPDADLEIVVDDTEANRLLALLKREGKVEAVIGKNAARQMIPYRRDLKLSSLTVNK